MQQRSIVSWIRLLSVLLMFLGAGAITIAVAADLLGMGGLPGFGANQISLALSGAAILVTGVILVLPAEQRRIGEWLLVGVGVVVTALAADLVVINTGLPDFGAKQLMIGSVGFGILLVGVAQTLPVGQGYIDEWSKQLAVDMEQVGKFLGIVVQLGLLVLVIRLYSLENEAFSHNIMLLTFYGFLIHHFLPLPFRLPFFLMLSLAGILGVLGFTNGAWLIGIGLLLIGICHLPVRYSVRVIVLLVAGLSLVVLRADLLQAPWSGLIWPILGSMFMFRLIVYLYDLKHQKEPVSISRTLSYFFLLPNVVFPLFPVVDYSTFRRTYYDDEDRYRIYQKGVDWILRGVFQLIVYRFVNHYLVIAPEDVLNVTDLVRYLVSNFLLYVRVSGQFHIIVGILHLFGFNLPETHHLYYLASSFTDHWRRINIYWKDFMLKVFYYPTYFRLRKWGGTVALVLATLFVFFATWSLHSVQWFWFRGSFLLAWQDALFWTILAFLVVANSLYETRHGRKRRIGKQTWSYKDVFPLALRTAGTFAAMCILWSFWTSASISGWLSLWSDIDLTVEGASVYLPTFLVAAALFGGAIRHGASGQKGGKKPGSGQPAFFRSVAVTGALILLLYLIGNPAVYSRFGKRAQVVIRDLRLDRINQQDADLLVRGYYEDLTGVNQFNSQLWEVYMKRPGDLENFDTTDAAQMTGDFLKIDLRPSADITFMSQPFHTNRWGMRDQDYDKLPPAGVYRIALLGASAPMGWGVADDETFEWHLEERLNQESTRGTYTGYEILNFSVSGHSTFQRLMVFENKALPFVPDAIFYTGHPDEAGRAIHHLVESVRNGVDVPYEYLREVLRKAEVDENTPEVVAKKRLQPYGDEMIVWAYRRMVQESRRQGMLPVWILLPRIVGVDEVEQNTKAIRLAEQAGFIVLDLSNVYEGQDIEAIRLAAWDWHPNAAGHELIAGRLYETLRDKQDVIPLDLVAD